MQYSIVLHSSAKTTSDFRLDAEYYRAEILNRINMLKHQNNDVLDNLVDFVVGPFGSTVTVDNYVKQSNYRYIRNKDINDFRINNHEPALLSKEMWSTLPQFHIQENDLLMTVVGTLGKVAIAREGDVESIFSCKSTILRTRRINPFFLLSYLNSETGKLFSLRGKRGAIQEGLNLIDLKEIQVFVPSNDFQSMIENMIKESFVTIKKSEEKYKQAQDLLLSELDLINWQPKHQLTFVKNYSDTDRYERIDAEYFQPKYDEITNAIKGYAGGWDTLGNLVTIAKCVEVGSDEYLNEGIPFVRVSNLSPFEITEKKYISDKLYAEMKQHQPTKGEILFTKDGTPGIACHLNDEPKKMIPSGGILRLKNKTDKVNNEYLTLVLNSILIKEQVNRDVGGSIILHWRPDQVKETVIPIPPEQIQTKIQQKITESLAMRKQSKHLLECAKRAVEIAIEKNEKAAIKWLEKQTAD